MIFRETILPVITTQITIKIVTGCAQLSKKCRYARIVARIPNRQRGRRKEVLSEAVFSDQLILWHSRLRREAREAMASEASRRSAPMQKKIV